MTADDLDTTLACLTDAAVSIEGLDGAELTPELQTQFLSLQNRINCLITFTEAYQRKLSLIRRRTVKVEKIQPVESTILDDEDLGEPVGAAAEATLDLPATT